MDRAIGNVKQKYSILQSTLLILFVVKRAAMKAAKDKKVDEAGAMWFMQKRSEGAPISGPILMTKALQFHTKLYPDGGEEFKASTGWLKNFQHRYGICQLAIQGEKFKDNLSRIIEEEGLTLNQVHNCDETGLFWKALPTNTSYMQRKKGTWI